MKPRLMFAICALFLFGGVARGEWLRQNDKVAFDDKNWLVFEDVGRIVYKDKDGVEAGSSAGKFVRLHVHRDGLESDIDLVDPKYKPEDYQYPLIKTQVKQIRYEDKDRLWVVARQGHLGDAALLYDIAAKKTVREYGGNNFMLSPMAGNIAFSNEYGEIYSAPSNPHCAVYVNELLVYPELKSGEGHADKDIDIGVDMPGKRVFKFPKSELAEAFIWRDATTLAFAVNEATSNGKVVRKQFVVTGLKANGARIDPAGLQVECIDSMPIENAARF